MPPIHGSKARVFANGYDVGQFLSSVSPSLDRDMAEATTLGKTAKVYVPGLGDASWDLDGIFFGAIDELDYIFGRMWDGIVSDAVIASYLPEGDGFGKRFMGMDGNLSEYAPESPLDGVTSASIGIQSSVGTDRGIVLHALQAEASSGNTTNVDNTAATTKGGAAVLQAVSGTSLVVKVQHSVDNSAWVDLITFASVSARGAQRVATAPTATVNRHVRVLWTGSGTFAVGFARQ